MANIINLNPSPKSQFHQTPAYVAAHRALIERDDLTRGLNFALLDYQASLALQTVDFQGAAANHFKMLGALEFIQHFKLLSEMPKPVSQPPKDNLDHKA